MHAPRMRSKQLEASDRNWQGSPCVLSVARIALWHLAVVWRHLAVARHLLPWQLLLLGLPGSERPSGGVEVKRRRARVHDEPGTMSVGTKSLSAMGKPREEIFFSLASVAHRAAARVHTGDLDRSRSRLSDRGRAHTVCGLAPRFATKLHVDRIWAQGARAGASGAFLSSLYTDTRDDV